MVERLLSARLAHSRASGDGLLSELIAGAQLWRREQVFVPPRRPCWRDRGTARPDRRLAPADLRRYRAGRSAAQHAQATRTTICLGALSVPPSKPMARAIRCSRPTLSAAGRRSRRGTAPTTILCCRRRDSGLAGCPRSRRGVAVGVGSGRFWCAVGDADHSRAQQPVVEYIAGHFDQTAPRQAWRLSVNWTPPRTSRFWPFRDSIGRVCVGGRGCGVRRDFSRLTIG